jgi:hypothetical protein
LVNEERLYKQELPSLLFATMNDDMKYSAERYRSMSKLERHHVYCKAASAKLSTRTQAYLGSPTGPGFTDKYELLREAGHALVAIARHSAGMRERTEYLMVEDARYAGAANPVSVSVWLVVDKNGLLSISDDPLLRALRGVRADRIRSCAVCKRIFWAPRVNSECCGETCRKTFNQRNSREARKLAARQKQKTKKGK